MKRAILIAALFAGCLAPAASGCAEPPVYEGCCLTKVTNDAEVYFVCDPDWIADADQQTCTAASGSNWLSCGLTYFDVEADTFYCGP